MTETFYDVMRRQGITRRSFLKFCSLTAAAMGLSPAYAGKIAEEASRIGDDRVLNSTEFTIEYKPHPLDPDKVIGCDVDHRGKY